MSSSKRKSDKFMNPIPNNYKYKLYLCEKVIIKSVRKYNRIQVTICFISVSYHETPQTVYGFRIVVKKKIPVKKFSIVMNQLNHRTKSNMNALNAQ